MAPLTLTPRVRGALRKVSADPRLNAGVKAMKSRSAEFVRPEIAELVGAAVVPEAREQLDLALNAGWDEDRDAKVGMPGVDEVIIGGGFHAAVYSAVRASLGFQKPLVLERRSWPGGAFAVSLRPTFYLNSRNRPGGPGRPAEGGTLNYLPGAPIQPYDLSSDEFQRNSDVAFVVRLTLALAARVQTGRKVVGVEEASTSGRAFRVVMSSGESVYADRVLDARGLGRPMLGTARGTNENIVTFPQLMRRMGGQFPLRGLRRVAVVGDGDSGRTAIEALTGQGPVSHWSIPGLDWVEQIDWYGRSLPKTCDDWLNTQRTRYKKIGSLLPRTNGGGAVANVTAPRVRPINGGATVTPGFDCAYVNDRAYDLVVICVGFRRKNFINDIFNDAFYLTDEGSNRQVATQVVGRELYQIGPAAGIGYSKSEVGQPFAQIPENVTAMFRLAGRTAALGRMLARPKDLARPKRPSVKVTVTSEAPAPEFGAVVGVDAFADAVQMPAKRVRTREAPEAMVPNKRGLTLGALKLEEGDRFTIGTVLPPWTFRRYTREYDGTRLRRYVSTTRPGMLYRADTVPKKVSLRVLDRLKPGGATKAVPFEKIARSAAAEAFKDPTALVDNKDGLTLAALKLTPGERFKISSSGPEREVKRYSKESDGTRYRTYVYAVGGGGYRTDRVPTSVSRSALGRLKKTMASGALVPNEERYDLARLALRKDEQFRLGPDADPVGRVRTFSRQADGMIYDTNSAGWYGTRVPVLVSRSALDRMA